MDSLLQMDIGQPASAAGLRASSGSARVGDKYHRNGIVVEITAVEIAAIGSETVTCKCTDKFGIHTFTVHFDEFIRLERKSLEWGATFEPLPNDQDQRPGH